MSFSFCAVVDAVVIGFAVDLVDDVDEAGWFLTAVVGCSVACVLVVVVAVGFVSEDIIVVDLAIIFLLLLLLTYLKKNWWWFETVSSFS